MTKKTTCMTVLVLLSSLTGSVSGGLVGHWALDEGSGGIAADASGYGNQGTLQGDPQWTDGFIGGALSFNGTSDYVDCGSGASLNINEKITMAAWVKIDQFQDWDGIITKGISQGPYAMQMWGDGSLRFAANWEAPAGAVGTGTWNSNAKMTAGEWVHAVTTYDGSTIRFYINGQKDSLEVAQNLTFGTVSESLTLGCDFPGGDEYFDGAMDDVRIYDRALTDEQAQELYGGTPPAFVKAEAPNPADGATGVVSQLFQWTPGETGQWHNVYLGTTAELTEANLVAPRSQFPMYWHVPGLVSGTTYYWRVDEVEADRTTIHTGDVWSFSVPATSAWNPVPADGAQFEQVDLRLSWTAGIGAFQHDVYFSTDENNVANGAEAAFQVNQAETTFDPGPLERGALYYWRVDELEADGTTVHAGEVWSFRTIPAIPIGEPNLVGWWKMNEGPGSNAVDWSGYENHGTLAGDPQWTEGYHGGALDFDGANDYVTADNNSIPTGAASFTIAAWIFPRAHQDDIITWWGRSGTAHNANGFRLMADGQIRHYFWGNDYDIVTGDLTGQWNHLALVHDGTGNRKFYLNGNEIPGTYTGTLQAPDVQQTQVYIGARAPDNTEYFDGLIDDVRLYDRALEASEIAETMRGDPMLAWAPTPANLSVPDIEQAAALAWSPGEQATEHDVYFGTDKDVVKAADAADGTGIYRGRQTTAAYAVAEPLEWGQTYFWRIDEYNADGTVSQGRVWSFTVAEYLLVDDFESYTNEVGQRVFQTWIDGLGYSEPPPGHPGNGTGALVGHDIWSVDSPYYGGTIVETDNVHGGTQAMPLYYDNSITPHYSETERTWNVPQDWTRKGVENLTLFYRGNPVRLLETDDSITISAWGNDIWNVEDQFRFVYKQLNGDGSILVRVDSVVYSDYWAKAGVMIRETLEAGSRHAAVIMTPSNIVAFPRRRATLNESTDTNEGNHPVPHWVKLTRTGDAFKAEHSVDGVTWVSIGPDPALSSDNIAMLSNVYVGLCLTSHNVGVPTVAEFSGVQTTGAFGQWQVAEIGADHPANDAQDLYVAVEDSTGRVGVMTHPDPAAIVTTDWTRWDIPIDDIIAAGANAAAVKKMYIGVGNRNARVTGGSGVVFLDDIWLTRPAPAVEPNEPGG